MYVVDVLITDVEALATLIVADGILHQPVAFTSTHYAAGVEIVGAPTFGASYLHGYSSPT